MSRILGIFKVLIVLALDFFLVYSLFGGVPEALYIALAVTAVIALYVLFGGYLSILKEGAVRAGKLPEYQSRRFANAKTRLVREVREKTGMNISGMKLYLVPGDCDLNATAYGANCISCTRGTFENADPVTLNAVLAHELSHTANCDPEFNRAVFCTVTILVALLSISSLAASIIIFLLFLILNGFKSWLGVMAYRGSTKAVSGLFELLKRSIVMIYRSVFSLVSRHAEYRCDRFACELGYGLQLAHFLSLAEPNGEPRLTLEEAMYRSHPPTPKRIARLEEMAGRRRAAAINR